MPAKPKIQFITQENKYKYLSQVLYWLKSDYDTKGMPGGHFWHNYSSIAEAFNDLHAMV